MMKLVLVLAAIVAASLLALLSAPQASAHSNPCHTKHECPSDHATYKWKGVFCVKPTSDKRTAAFTKKVVYAGKPYYCKK